MRHGVKKGKTLGRVKKVRKGLMRSLAVALIENGAIITTETKAKELSKVIEPWLTKAKKDAVSTRRFLARHLPPHAVTLLVNEIAPRYKERSGGYTRIIKMGRRETDNAPLARMSFV